MASRSGCPASRRRRGAATAATRSRPTRSSSSFRHRATGKTRAVVTGAAPASGPPSPSLEDRMRLGKKMTADRLLGMHPDRAHEEKLRRRGVSAWLLEWVPPEVFDGVKKPQEVPRRERRVVGLLS